jgi:hypothetical protein
LGIVYTENEYNHYFNQFLVAQALRLNNNRNPNALDRVKDTMDWKPHYTMFLTTQVPMSQIKVVIQYKMKMKKAANGNTLTGGFMKLGFGGNRKLGR